MEIYGLELPALERLLGRFGAVIADSLGRNDEILTAVKTTLRDRFQIRHATIQIESDGYAHVNDICAPGK